QLHLHSFPTRRSSDLTRGLESTFVEGIRLFPSSNRKSGFGPAGERIRAGWNVEPGRLPRWIRHGYGPVLRPGCSAVPVHAPGEVHLLRPWVPAEEFGRSAGGGGSTGGRPRG